jgi:thiosulfate/3-mercaptopyruvate sulfurtransferase
VHKTDFGPILEIAKLRNSQLIQAQELYEHLQDDSWCTIDCRSELSDPGAGQRDYDTAHIPAAVFADLNEDLAAPLGEFTGRHPLPDVVNITATIGRLGIDNNTTVVVYDNDNGAVAARTWWTLRWLGHTNVRVLDGGLAAWSKSQYPLSSELVVPGRAEFVSGVRNELVITTAEICEAGANIASLNIFDARDLKRFLGEDEPIDKVAGHVPGARSLPFPVSMNDDGYWKGVQELQQLWRRELGDDRHTEWVVMCGSGVTACHLALSAVAAGYRDPRLYVGSWSEWITDSGRPIGLGYG